MAERQLLIRGGSVLTMDAELGDFERGDVLIDGRRIAAVGRELEARADEVIDASGMIVLPGLIDTHVHLWETALRGLGAESWGMDYFTDIISRYRRYRPDDVYAATFAGAIQLINNGITTVLDFCHCLSSTAYADPGIRALLDAGVRGRFGYSLRMRPDFAGTHEDRLRDLVRVRDQYFSTPDGLLGLMVAVTDMEQCDIERTRIEYTRARELGLRITMHSNFPWQVGQLAEAGLLGPDLLLVHGTVITDDELGMMAEHGTALAVTPETELGHGRPMTVIGRAFRAGVRLTLGGDVPPYVTPDPIMQMRTTYMVQGSLDGKLDRDEGRGKSIRRQGVPTFRARDMLRFMTTNGAAVLGLDDRVGSLTPGKDADVVLIDTRPWGMAPGIDPAGHLVMQANVGEVDTVIVAGTIRKRNGRLVGVDLDRLAQQLDETRARVAGPA